MTPDRYRQVKELFCAALERPASERAAFLTSACGDDGSLLQGVKDLIAQHDDQDESLGIAAEGSVVRLRQSAVPALSAEAQPDSSGIFGLGTLKGLYGLQKQFECSELTDNILLSHDQQGLSEENPQQINGVLIGRYRVVRHLGSGGMGAVYLALRDDDFRKEVAIKLLRRGMDTEAIVNRFRTERQILAGLDHANIARLIDGGVTLDGRPYLVMDYIAGERIDQYCEQRTLPVRERLELFRKVCAAVHYAHQNLVVHRDLKCGNILVAIDGEPKLLDFGIAKLLNRTPDEEAIELTTPGGRLMTPEYASPEQVRGQVVTTATDVYSLGVVLYELLAGRKPYEFPTRTPLEIERVICEQEPPSLGHRLGRDLDTIVRMALHKDPRRRYGSAEQFSEDIRRYLVGLPVMARKDTVSYRAVKFARRNRGGVVAAGLVFLSLAGGVVATSLQARRAEARFQDVRRLANSMLFEVHDAITDLPGSTAARALIVRRALEFLDKLASDAGPDRGLSRDLASAYVQVGNAQGNPNGANLGDLAGAKKNFEKAERLAGRIVAEAPQDMAAYRVLALALEKKADVEAHSGEVVKAVNDERKSREMFAIIAQQQPHNTRAQLSLVISKLKLGDVIGHPAFNNAGDLEGALQEYRDSLAEMGRRLPPGAEEPRATRYRALLHERIGYVLRSLGRTGEALEQLQKCAEIRAQLAAVPRVGREAQRDQAIVGQLIAETEADAGKWKEAIAGHERALGILETLSRADPNDSEALHDVAYAHLSWGETLVRAGRPVEAEAHISKYLATNRLSDERERGRALVALALARLRSGKGASGVRSIWQEGAALLRIAAKQQRLTAFEEMMLSAGRTAFDIPFRKWHTGAIRSGTDAAAH
jgi:tetratricopeptide (TPR) repeat protein